jgi:hypothetical protein
VVGAANGEVTPVRRKIQAVARVLEHIERAAKPRHERRRGASEDFIGIVLSRRAQQLVGHEKQLVNLLLCFEPRVERLQILRKAYIIAMMANIAHPMLNSARSLCSLSLDSSS